MNSDPIADMIVRIKNAALAGLPTASFPASNLKMALAEALKQAGYLTAVSPKGKKVKKTIEVTLAYEGQQPRLQNLKRVSKPSRRIYRQAGQLRPVRQGFGAMLLSTSRGVMTDQAARAAKVGGEVLCVVW